MVSLVTLRISFKVFQYFHSNWTELARVEKY